MYANRWFGDYDKLEYKHGFIQWLYVRFLLLLDRSDTGAVSADFIRDDRVTGSLSKNTA